MSLRTKIIFAFIIIVVGVAFSLVLFVNLDNPRQVQNYMLKGGMFGVEDVVVSLENYYQTNNSWRGVNSILASTHQGMMNDRGMMNQLTLTDTDLKVIWSSAGHKIGEILPLAEKSNALRIQNSLSQTVGFLIINGRSAPQPADISPLISKLKSTATRVGLVAVFLAILIAILISNRLIRPVKLLTTASQTLSKGDLSARVKVKGNDELAILGRTFNEMAEHLQYSEERKKALTADVAHELRTPLSVQKAQLEAMQDGIVPMNEENLQTVIDQTNFLARLVEDMRTLALVDAGELQLEIQDVNLPELIQQVIERFQPQAVLHKISLKIGKVNCPDHQFVAADPDRLAQIYSNLISNALQHTPEGGKVILSLSEKENTFSSTIQDNGCGIPEASLPFLFERFYRGDKSRSREYGSTGLGLSIARNLARVHGGDLSAANFPTGGAVFTLVLPVKNNT